MNNSDAEDSDIADPYKTDDASDYVPENDSSLSDDEPTHEIDAEATKNEEGDHKTPSTTRKRKRNVKKWKVNQKKSLRNAGKAYISHRSIPHPPRQLALYQHSCRFNCNLNVLEADRQTLFQKFYALSSYDLQNSFLSSCIKKKPVQRKKVEDSGKSFSTEIFLINKRVCKMFFLKTFDISNKRFTTVCQKSNAVGICEKDNRGQGPGRKIESEKREVVIKHIKLFPKYRSHYSRSANFFTRYLSPELNIRKMYDLYIEHCTEENLDPVKHSYYRHIFNTEFNLRFHRPNSDTCSKCDGFNNIIKNSDNAEKLNTAKVSQTVHHRKAQKARESKQNDSNVNKESTDTFVICFDLQQALPTPHITTSKVFYLRQLWTYNFCIHNLVTGKSDMYVWDETIASRGSQEIGSCLIHYITNAVPQNVTKIIAYSDSCGGQNKNKNIAKLFMYLVKATRIQEIHHKFLEPGHTFMECDQDFGIIEKVKRKNPQVFVPEHWRQLIKSSCKKFMVHEMSKENFFSFSNLNNIISDPKKDTEKRAIKWREIQYFFFTKESERFCFFYKITLDSEFPFNKCLCPGKAAGRPKLTLKDTFDQLNRDSLKINELKWKNLQTLLEYVPPKYHEYYNSMQHEKKEKSGNNKTKANRNKKQTDEVEPQDDTQEENNENDVDFILYSDDE